MEDKRIVHVPKSEDILPKEVIEMLDMLDGVTGSGVVLVCMDKKGSLGEPKLAPDDECGCSCDCGECACDQASDTEITEPSMSQDELNSIIDRDEGEDEIDMTDTGLLTSLINNIETTIVDGFKKQLESGNERLYDGRIGMNVPVSDLLFHTVSTLKQIVFHLKQAKLYDDDQLDTTEPCCCEKDCCEER